MIKIAISARKGGTGKTTTATNIAGISARAGYAVAAIDLDPQQGFTRWLERRNRTDIQSEQSAPSSNVDITIIDLPNIPLDQIAALLDERLIDLVIIPTRVGPDDLHGAIATVRACRGKNVQLLLSQVRRRTRLAESARDQLETACLPVFRGVFGLRETYVEAAYAGLDVAEYAPASPAACELTALWREMAAMLGIPEVKR